MNDVFIKQAQTDWELEQAFAIRQEVFVFEQKMFEQTDRDENDTDAVLLIALINGGVAGTVRVFSENGNGSWVGGRLAVKKEFRGTKAGSLLVQEAVRLAAERRAKRFWARIQLANVAFFEKLGWKAAGPVVFYRGYPHRVMVADLKGAAMAKSPCNPETE